MQKIIKKFEKTSLFLKGAAFIGSIFYFESCNGDNSNKSNSTNGGSMQIPGNTEEDPRIIKQKENEINDLKTQIKNLENKIRNLEKNKPQENQSKPNTNTSQKELDKLNKDLEKLKKNLESKDNFILNKENEINDLKTQIKDLENKIRNLEKNKLQENQIKPNTNTSQKELDKLNKDLDELKKNLESKDETIYIAKGKIDELSKINEDLKNKNQNLETSLQLSTSNNKNLNEKEIGEIKKELEMYKLKDIFPWSPYLVDKDFKLRAEKECFEKNKDKFRVLLDFLEKNEGEANESTRELCRKTVEGGCNWENFCNFCEKDHAKMDISASNLKNLRIKISEASEIEEDKLKFTPIFQYPMYRGENVPIHLQKANDEFCFIDSIRGRQNILLLLHLCNGVVVAIFSHLAVDDHRDVLLIKEYTRSEIQQDNDLNKYKNNLDEKEKCNCRSNVSRCNKCNDRSERIEEFRKKFNEFKEEIINKQNERNVFCFLNNNDDPEYLILNPDGRTSGPRFFIPKDKEYYIVGNYELKMQNGTKYITSNLESAGSYFKDLTEENKNSLELLMNTRNVSSNFLTGLNPEYKINSYIANFEFYQVEEVYQPKKLI